MNAAGGVHVAGDIELVPRSSGEVFRAVRWRSVDHASAGVHGHVISDYAQNLPALRWQKRVVEPGVLHHVAGESGNRLRIWESAFFCNVFGQFLRNDVDCVAYL